MFSDALPCRRHRHRIGLAPSEPVSFGARVGWQGLLLAWPLGSQIGPFRRLRSPRHPLTSVSPVLARFRFIDLSQGFDLGCRQSNASRCSTGSMTMAATPVMPVMPSTSTPLYEGRDRGSLTVLRDLVDAGTVESRIAKAATATASHPSANPPAPGPQAPRRPLCRGASPDAQMSSPFRHAGMQDSR